MFYHKAISHFLRRRVRKSVGRYIINEAPRTLNDKLYPQIPFLIRSRKYNIKNKYDNTPQGQFFGLTFPVTDLIRDERIVLNYNKAVEIRPQVERLIVEAMRNGDKHKPTMALANFWLREKNLIHKLFKVLVPRYSNYSSAFTAIHMLGHNYEQHKMSITERENFKGTIFKMGEAVLELRGNELPPIIRPKLAKSGLLTNILIDGARESLKKQQQLQQAALPRVE